MQDILPVLPSDAEKYKKIQKELTLLKERKKHFDQILLWLFREYKKPGINSFQIKEKILRYYLDNNNYKITLENADIIKERCHSFIINMLLEKKISSLSIEDIMDENFFNIPDITASSPNIILCNALPYGYPSHITAMVYYDLTNRLPKEIHYTLPLKKKWEKYEQENVSNRIPTEITFSSQKAKDHLIQLFKLPFPSLLKINEYPVHFHKTRHFKNPKKNYQSIRIPEIGEVFLTMLKEPDLCGGVQHVIEVWEEYAGKYYKQIIEAAERSTFSIDKARVGYWMTDKEGKSSPLLDEWQKEQMKQRGGSRKFIASEKYTYDNSDPYFSEKWGISLNHPSLREDL